MHDFRQYRVQNTCTPLSAFPFQVYKPEQLFLRGFYQHWKILSEVSYAHYTRGLRVLLPKRQA